MRRMAVRTWTKLGWVLLLAAIACKAPPPAQTEVTAVPAARLPAGPGDPAWDAAPVYNAKLLLQDLVDPRLLVPSTAEVRVQAVASGPAIAWRLRWQDPEKNDVAGPGKFVDACAVQLPAEQTAGPPAPQMGESGRGVEIAYWRADWQAWVDGRKDSIKAIYPNAEITHYPFEAASLPTGSPEQQEMARRFAPAEAVGNRRQGTRRSAVESLVAEGPGTLTPNPAIAVDGGGKHGKDGWAVMITRPLPAGLLPGKRTSVAFAVWQGAAQEGGARKMRSGWAPLLVRQP